MIPCWTTASNPAMPAPPRSPGVHRPRLAQSASQLSRVSNPVPQCRPVMLGLPALGICLPLGMRQLGQRHVHVGEKRRTGNRGSIPTLLAPHSRRAHRTGMRGLCSGLSTPRNAAVQVYRMLTGPLHTSVTKDVQVHDFHDVLKSIHRICGQLWG